MQTGQERSPLAGRPIIFGEVLFDRFPDGKALLGGAPFNVAWHLHGFGAAPLFVSRIGADAPGAQVVEAMSRWEMDRAGLQHDPERPTGSVEITLEAGQPSFDICPDQAYDHIAANAALAAATHSPTALLYHGTLALRSPPSREALARLRALPGLPAFVDVNLRAPWWDRDTVLEQLSGTRWAKLNADELGALGAVGGALGEAADAFRRRLGVEWVVLTRGDEGALLAGPETRLEGAPHTVRHLADTVGAGDAFSAVTLLGLLRGWPMDETLRRALEFAAAVCEIQGALFHDQADYGRFLHAWEE